ncbi:GNAT family N-acetyltransferase [Streptomyces himalayensis]|uniref:GNAT family N-acetyltransferase n=1 Tax=Streptomyces himalayensis subsp. himalayensis TaxID=2756131 RepID=A0A7W0ICQ1_9ACTN|nr:GNAT family N-acetyltransferase [Streptomyces himalayensis]MBA2950793.1 GNAT family N-acetyltransferase [Streptomyces himalayensis subsp. himalayensis]
MTRIQRLSSAELLAAADALGDLLSDVVDGGSSLGFLAPFDPGAAAAWWRSLAPAVAHDRLAVWTARDGDRVIGTVSVAFADKPNGRHRAEINKLMVHRTARGQGLGRTLLTTAESAAAAKGVTLLILDTQTASPAESLYRAAGWTAAGVIPDFATDPAGTLHPTTLFYKRVNDIDPVKPVDEASRVAVQTST